MNAGLPADLAVIKDNAADPEGFEVYLKAVRDFSQNVLRPSEEILEETDAIPEEITQQLRDMGLFGISLPKEYSGLGLTQEQQVRLTFEFTQASCVYRSRFSTTIGLCSQMVLDYGTEEQKREFLPRMATGEMTAAFALTERDAGSDAGGLETTAERTNEGYVLNGIKRYITNAPDADLFVVMAVTGKQPDSKNEISVFLVDADTPGATPGPAERMMGQRGSHVSEIFFENCLVSDDRLLGLKTGNGLKMALRGINHARTHVAATCVGQGIRLLEEAVNYAKGREQFGQPIAEFQAIQVMIGERRAELAAARALTLEVARKFDEGPIPYIDIACAKMYASEMLGRIADQAVQILGGMGYMKTYPVERLCRDVRVLRIFEGTSQIHQINIAKNALKHGIAETM